MSCRKDINVEGRNSNNLHFSVVYHVHFHTNTPGKGMTTLIFPTTEG